MFLTKEILTQYNACQEGIDWFIRNFPNGAELIDVIRYKHAIPYFLHWGKLHLTTSPEEQRAYYEVLHVENSTNTFECRNVKNSNMVTNSENVSDSQYIYNSNDITQSDDVRHSKKVQNSQHIISSSSIFSSTHCLETSSVKNGHNISFSNFVIDSHDVYYSNLINKSSFIFKSENVDCCGFVAHSQHLNNGLFCYEYDNQNYGLFNHEIGETQWNFLYEEYLDQIKDYSLCLFNTWDPENLSASITGNHNYLTMFKNLFVALPNFISWVQHLPYYNAEIAYNITFIPNFLQ